MHRLAACLLAACVLSGCDRYGSPVMPWSRNAAPPPPASRPAASQPVMAVVAGRPIFMSEMNDLLVRAHGLPVAFQLVTDEVVRQAAQAKDLTADPNEVQAESDRTLADLLPQSTAPDQRQHLLADLLKQRGLSPKQWQLAMTRNVLLRKLAEPRVTVTDNDLSEEFARQFGRKVEVRHIQTDSLPAAQKVLTLLNDGADFADLARRLSTNPSAAEGGLLPLIAEHSVLVPPGLRDAALALTQVGELSKPVQVEMAYHVLRLEKVHPPQDVRFDDVKDALARDARDRLLRLEQRKVLAELIQAAQDAKSIQYVDPTLRAQVESTGDQPPPP